MKKASGHVNNKIMKLFVCLNLLVLILSGCTSARIPAEPVPVSPAVRETASPALSGADLHLTERVATIIAIRTASATPNPTHLPIPTWTPGPTLEPTQIAFLTQRPLFEQNCGGIQGYFYNDNTWAICSMSSHKVVLFSTDGRLWKFSYDDLGFGRPGEGPEYITRPFYWTKDGRYVYLMPSPEGYDPLGPFLAGGVALVRLDLENGEVHNVLPPDYFYAVEFSPTGRRLAYVRFKRPLKLVIEDLQSGASNQIDLDPGYTQAGWFVWSDDGLKVAYMLIIDGDECSRKIAIKLINIEDLSSVTLVPDTQVNTCQMVDPTFYVDEVNTDSVILEQKGDRWIYEIPTGQLRLLATATPGP